MKNFVQFTAWTSLLFILFACPSIASVSENNPQSNGWDFDLELYFWGASVDGTSATGSAIELQLDDILSSLEFAVMAAAKVQKGKWSFITDVVYLDLEDSETVAPGLDATVALTGWVVTPFAGYNLVDNQNISLDVMFGARYLSLDAGLTVGPVSVDDSGSHWNGIVGLRGAVNLTENWYLPYLFDIGTGDSELTYQLYGGAAYRFETFDIIAAYRYLRWEFDNNRAFEDLYFSGPFIGFKFKF